MTRTAASFSRGLALLVAATFFMENLDGTIIQTAAPTMAREFGVAPAELSIAMVAYLLAVAAGIPATGWLSTRIGVRPVLLTAIVVFTVASVLCAFAPTLTLLTLARVLQGIGGALMVPVGRLAVLSETEPRDLLDAIAYLTWPALIAPVIAPALGGILTDTVGWRWIFLINVPLGIAAVIAGLRLIPHSEPQRGAPFDLRGYLAIAFALVLLTAGAEALSADDPLLEVVGAVAIVASAGMVWANIATSRERAHALFDWSVLRRSTFRAGNLGGGVYRMIITGAPFLFTLLFQLAYGWSATVAGLLVIAVFVGNLGIKPFTTPLIRRFGFRRILIWSNALGMLVLLAFVAIGPEAPVALLVLLLIVSGVFRSIGFSAYNTLQFADIEPDETTNANTLASALQQVAVALGLAVVAVFVRASTAVSEGLTGSALPGYHWAFALAAALLLLPLVGALRLPHDAGTRAIAAR
ncbi:MFS transporter [Leifsonia shinshuensis]|uniref:MFS transporter n=1 Tax=Leifsonia shinshuensis TaxID=150026 RepID=UPI002864E16B|nr:MFS transporter [Leifsonia shinshuensis]MDR6972806.1 EmrB/QacA subfamily drug resistance transporter [Leifsonia shinshuensis]